MRGSLLDQLIRANLGHRERESVRERERDRSEVLLDPEWHQEGMCKLLMHS